ncbi:MAG: hypothetical protein DHS20C11_11340 [Lysobacteraceae bacterium]|nr:MAG: hypothetical protein DHS20C11_11340 [Xanthomonadaceae bacterium]
MKTLFGAGILMLFSAVGHAGQTPVQEQSASAPPESTQFGQLVGQWRIKDFMLDQDGNWQAGNGADWNFYWILGGTAIQDDWIAPPMSVAAPDTGRQLGTNIRIYNPKQQRWEMAWASNTGAKVDTFSAVETDGQLLMRGLFNGVDSQIIFYDITADHFSWKLQRILEGSDQWVDVYRIEADRVRDTKGEKQ